MAVKNSGIEEDSTRTMNLNTSNSENWFAISPYEEMKGLAYGNRNNTSIITGNVTGTTVAPPNTVPDINSEGIVSEHQPTWNIQSPGSTTLEDVLDSLLGLPSASRSPSPGPISSSHHHQHRTRHRHQHQHRVSATTATGDDTAAATNTSRH